MNILILGGTGAMGKYLQQILDNGNNILTITSRRANQSSTETVHYVQGNAKDLNFLKVLLEQSYDIIIDFMYYSTIEFKERYKILLRSTSQYIFISSARVYAQTEEVITEDTQRLLDVCKDKEYLKTDEYALAKARSEDLLYSSGKKNFTIIRPSITYAVERLQLGVLEKENWLYRALHGRSIVFSEDIASKYTAMTIGEDVAKGISALIGNQSALGETFHITCETSYTWNDILNCYLKVLDKHGIRPNIIMTEKSVNLNLKGKKYQVIYCRYFNRRFDNSKIRKYVDVDAFIEPLIGLTDCLEQFLNAPKFKQIDWKLEALNDKAAHEYTPLYEIPSLKNKIIYLCYRYNLNFIVNSYQKLKLHISDMNITMQ